MGQWAGKRGSGVNFGEGRINRLPAVRRTVLGLQIQVPRSFPSSALSLHKTNLVRKRTRQQTQGAFRNNTRLSLFANTALNQNINTNPLSAHIPPLLKKTSVMFLRSMIATRERNRQTEHPSPNRDRHSRRRPRQDLGAREDERHIPPFSFFELIAMAMCDSDDGERLSSVEIRDYIMEHFAYYRHAHHQWLVDLVDTLSQHYLEVSPDS